jgi:hypothetical protein
LVGSTFDDPTPLVAPQFTAIFVAPIPIVLAARRDQLDAAFLQSLARRVRVIGGVGNHSFRLLPRTAFGPRNRDFLEPGSRPSSRIATPRPSGGSTKCPRNLETTPVRGPRSTPVVPPAIEADARLPVFHHSTRERLHLGPPYADSDVTFNLSHAGGVALLAFSRNRELGVDGERVRRDLDVDSIARRLDDTSRSTIRETSQPSIPRKGERPSSAAGLERRLTSKPRVKASRFRWTNLTCPWREGMPTP